MVDATSFYCDRLNRQLSFLELFPAVTPVGLVHSTCRYKPDMFQGDSILRLKSVGLRPLEESFSTSKQITLIAVVIIVVGLMLCVLGLAPDEFPRRGFQ